MTRPCACGCGRTIDTERGNRLYARAKCRPRPRKITRTLPPSPPPVVAGRPQERGYVAPAERPQRKNALLTPTTVEVQAPKEVLNRLESGEAPSRPDSGSTPEALPAEPYARLREGERRLDKAGYVRIRHDGQIKAEHRVIMERTLGRQLVKGESVHHRNGIRSDNRPENLELWVGPARYGQRAHEIHCPACGTSYADAVGATEALLRHGAIV